MGHQVHNVSPKGGATNFSLVGGGGQALMPKPYQCWWGWCKAIEEGRLFRLKKWQLGGVTKTFVAKWASIKSCDYMNGKSEALFL